ncbi:methylmalonyl-CoA carboxyltransferase [Azospirillum thiophilum]|uniref:Methylmalonyl-CoA carboxyltransferase n=1 Tax=Azospirillum thiophilum TaxID=528244 RepID=A0AAC8W3D1_9PROT|nr:carboxyl transferase domain-containing protein [Azospirillum thiophilum]ALG74353.1 methylmalonyl-CoA carboxyltransferase [Azospirillum thiophilum]KJR63779.1 methylmalonyl-CoA carboxyltransferase [Azospirillum thiophilum]
MKFQDHIQKLHQQTEHALGMGGPEKLAKRRAKGMLNARERLDVLLDPESFWESGMFGRSIRPEMGEKSPADGKIAGYGRIDGRDVAVVSNDFTVLGASSSAVNGKKIRHMREVASKRGMPMVFLGESVGARMPDRMGAPGRAMLGQDPGEYLRDRHTPWASALLGDCYGSSTWYACVSDFVVMRKGATMAVASSRVTSMAISETIDPEDLGGWRLHSSVTGLVDMVVDSEEEALQAVRTFLGYLPSHAGEEAPRRPVPEGSDDASDRILDVLPEERTKVYDVRDVINCVVDTGSFFELKARFGKSITTGLARIDGRSVGVIASNPRVKGGAIDVDAMRKATGFLVLCDSFNLPIVFLVDQPGFLIGVEGERRWAPGRIMNWMNALSLVTVPKLSVLMRKSYGQAYLNMGGGRHSDEVLSWPTADLGFVDPAVGVNILHGIKESDDPERFRALYQELQKDSSAWALAALYETHAVIDPRATRAALKRLLAVHAERGPGRHQLATWPTSY